MSLKDEFAEAQHKQVLAAIAAALDDKAKALARIELVLARIADKPTKQDDGRTTRGKYPWDELERQGKFFWPCSPDERHHVQKSISAGAHQRYGSGRVSVKRTKGGLLVRQKVRKVDGEGKDG